MLLLNTFFPHIFAYNYFSLLVFYLAFAWLRCHKDGLDDLEAFLRENKIITRGGPRFGVDEKVVRVSMLDTDEAFNMFIGRIASLK
jgi:L-tryptophan---pyruvate aminotransferase